ncbi:MAG: response regulator [Rhodobacteraceae bacterium]|nr:response regulator [Paracoccaceae bacterium]
MPTRILIAEDEPNIVEALRFLLRRAGYEVEHADDGERALARLLASPPDLLILDVMLPSRNGFEILKMVRAEPAIAALPVVMLTAKGQSHDRRVAAEIGANVFLTKPFSNAQVVDEVRRLAAP